MRRVPDVVVRWTLLVTAWFGVIVAVQLSLAVGALAVAMLLSALVVRGRHEDALLTLLLIFFLSDSRQPELRALADLRYPAMGIAGLYAFFGYGRGRLADPRVLAFVPFVGIAILGAVAGPLPFDALLKMAAYALLVLTVFQYLLPVVRRDPERMLGAVVGLFSGLLLLGLVLIPLAPEIAFMSGAGGRFRGLLGNPNGLGIFCTLFLPLVVLYFDRVRTDEGALRWGCVALVLVCVVLTGSRSALMASTVFLALYHGLSGSMLRRGVAVGVVAPLALLFLLTAPLEELVYAAGMGEYLRVEGLEYGSGRTLAWAYAGGMVWEAPFVGRGFDYDGYLFERETLASLGVGLGGHQGGVHNSFLSFVLNTGFLGLAAFGFFLFRVMRDVRPDAFFLAFLGAALVSATFESWLMASLNAYTIFFFVTITGLLSVQRRIAADPDPEPQRVSSSAVPVGSGLSIE